MVIYGHCCQQAGPGPLTLCFCLGHVLDWCRRNGLTNDLTKLEKPRFASFSGLRKCLTLLFGIRNPPLCPSSPQQPFNLFSCLFGIPTSNKYDRQTDMFRFDRHVRNECPSFQVHWQEASSHLINSSNDHSSSAWLNEFISEWVSSYPIQDWISNETGWNRIIH